MNELMGVLCEKGKWSLIVKESCIIQITKNEQNLFKYITELYDNIQTLIL